jgi:hypothetical protein
LAPTRASRRVPVVYPGRRRSGDAAFFHPGRRARRRDVRVPGVQGHVPWVGGRRVVHTTVRKK